MNKFSFRVSKIWKTTFPKEFVDEIWLKENMNTFIFLK